MQLLSVERPERALFWTAPASANNELATEDPLGFDYVAQQIGLLLLPALTTRSTRAQGFAMVLYGLALADRAVAHYGLPATDEERRKRFEPWERFWALAALEYKKGMPRGDWDTMRGIRGVKAIWKPGDGPLPLRFKMISRQQELGNLGAYLVPLRRAGLVADGTLRPTPAAHEIIENFWDERRDRDHVGRFDDYALTALDPKRAHIDRKHGTLSLATVGDRSRLLSLVERNRAAQQRRLDTAIFERRTDANTQRLAQIVAEASQRNITASEHVLDGAASGAFGAVAEPLQSLIVTALAFGRFVQHALNAFDRAYQHIQSAGLMVDTANVVRAVFDANAVKSIADASRALQGSPAVSEIRGFPMHGAACLRLASALTEADGATMLRLLLEYHSVVQRDRRRGSGWIREDREKLLLGVSSYSARAGQLRFPSYKLDAVRVLLCDVGRLRFSGLTAPEVLA